MPTNFYGFSKQRRIIVEHVEDTCVRKIEGWEKSWREREEKIECEQYRVAREEGKEG